MKPELILKREEFIKELIENPIDNDKFIATFTKTSPHSGDVIFQDKIIDRISKALWGVYIKNDEIVATLSNSGSESVFETTIENYRSRIDEEIIILNLFSDRKRK